MRSKNWDTRFCALAMLLSCLIGCQHSSSSPPPAATPARLPQFTDVTERAGIRFIHNHGAFGKKYMPETTGSGCCFLDYNNDGWLDILLVNSMDWPGHKTQVSLPALYHNNRDGTFTDATWQAGLAIEVYGMGCAVGDYDNDGFDDIYISCIGPNYLFHNNGNGTFTNVTETAGTSGVAPPKMGLRWKWSSSCAWLDYDKDGWLDLLAGNYVKWSPQTNVQCGKPSGPRGYCPPNSYEGVPCTLYHNNHNGTFTDVSTRTGIARHVGKTWGVAVCDFDGDGWIDIAVANDTVPNFYFRNHKGQKFTEEAVETGIAVGETGSAKAGMGIDFADWRNNGQFGLLIGNFSNEALSLYDYEGGGFTDVAQSTGMAEASFRFLTFGLFFFDYDLDGWQDAFCANGHIDDLVNRSDSRITYAQRPMLFHNRRGGRFEEVGLRSGKPLNEGRVLRGCAYGDYDNDGDLDILVVGNNRDRASLWRNDGGNRNHWIRFKCKGTESNHSGIGTQVLVKAGRLTQRQWVKSGSSYLSQSDLSLTFGLGSVTRADEVEIRWPRGRIDRCENLKSNSEYTVLEGGSCDVVGRGG